MAVNITNFKIEEFARQVFMNVRKFTFTHLTVERESLKTLTSTHNESAN